MRIAIVLAVLLAARCATLAQPAAPSPEPNRVVYPPAREKSFLEAMEALFAAVPVKSPRTNYIRLVYPASAPFPFWTLERSSNLVAWESVLKNCVGPPRAESDVTVYTTNGPVWVYRMRNHAAPE